MSHITRQAPSGLSVRQFCFQENRRFGPNICDGSVVTIGDMRATTICLASAAIDMRKGFDRLSEIVRAQLELDPQSGALFARTIAP